MVGELPILVSAAVLKTFTTGVSPAGVWVSLLQLPTGSPKVSVRISLHSV